MGKWQPGQSGNPAGGKPGHHNGRPPGGRSNALRILDTLLVQKKSEKKIRKALADEIDTNALGFFKTVIMPLLPRESKIEVDATGIVQWTRLSTTVPHNVQERDPD